MPTTLQEERLRIINQINKAMKRIGMNSSKNLTWLIDFAERKLDDLNSRKQEELLAEVKALGLLASHANQENIKKVLGYGIQEWYEPNWQDVMILQVDAKRMIDFVINVEKKEFYWVQVKFRIAGIKGPMAGDGKIYFIPKFEDARSAFRTRIGHVFQECGHLITRCLVPTCKKIFVKKKAWQGYCSSTCQGLINMRVRRGTQKTKTKLRTLPTTSRKQDSQKIESSDTKQKNSRR